jgi:phosphoribosyl-ATP pyrophosphohydrolase/phosphoribosyl-AMP cyclohydrolase
MPTPTLSWNADGLVPAVVQDAASGAVLMLAYLNAEAWARTLATGRATFWSRSRQALWEKGATSGNGLRVEEIRIDCDRDAVLLRCTPAGPTCHTGTTACFFQVVENHGASERSDDGVPTAAPALTSARLDQTIAARRATSAERSYTRALLDGGPSKLAAKVTEEAGEFVAELATGDRARLIAEAADVVFHLAVALASRDASLDDVWRELARREGVSGHAEKAARTRP